MTWNLIVPRGHRIAGRRRVKLEQLVREPLILYERGSTGRQHVLDAFYDADCLRSSRSRRPRRRLSSAWSKPGWESPSFRSCRAAP